jgi:hypothetical protein
VLRLTGLPAVSRYPRASVERAADGIAIVFSGDTERRVWVDLSLLGPVQDLEATELDLLAKLQAMGYEVEWRSERGA